ncbi:1215_t:CDS:2 [Ambispora gerdemannii]|uniref:1215_t:CDS:1 n=1 Tax=Ambispora gerdemannii TaxID=144530 RepID=A0A9N9AXC1_9GLOM|nr:1215_t:CDS:2 [Ambispora gerdemannii]
MVVALGNPIEEVPVDASPDGVELAPQLPLHPPGMQISSLRQQPLLSEQRQHPLTPQLTELGPQPPLHPPALATKEYFKVNLLLKKVVKRFASFPLKGRRSKSETAEGYNSEDKY